MKLTEFSTQELLNELDRRRKQRVVTMPERKAPLVFRCTTCGAEIQAGNRGFFADSTMWGTIWHYSCTDRANADKVGRMTVIQGELSGGICGRI